jgi:hypothetical protein
MGSGSDLRCNIIRMNYAADDEVGGAVTTGTIAHEYVHFSLQELPREQLLLQQGLEVQNQFQSIVFPGTLTVQERDEIEIVFPPNHHYYGDRFRVVGIQYSSLVPSDPRSYLMLSLVRSTEAHSKQ